MSANLDLVRSIYVDWERGDFNSSDWAHSEIEFVIEDGPSPGECKGVVAMASAFRDAVGAWAEFRAKPDEYRVLDEERLLVLNRGGGRGKTSGLEIREMQMRGANVFHVRSGKVARLVIYFDRERALADLGLTPAAG